MDRPDGPTQSLNDSSTADARADSKGPGQLIVEITTDLSTLIRKEIELAKQEVGELVKTKVQAFGLIAVAAVVGLLFLPFILLTFLEILAIWLPRWSASLIITFSMLAMAGGLVLMAKKKLDRKLKPEKTINSLKEDVEWAKNLKKS
ncbi:MAG TPA: phage holin family protein [Actinomycetota bacterium]|nr:phage holin family protein [Actinomycetota bacterium]